MNQIIRLVFVYGTLKTNQPNHYWLTNPSNGISKFIAAGQTIERFPLVIGTRYSIPFLVDERGTGNCIEGEIYEVDENMMNKLDELEGYPTFYTRNQIDVKDANETIFSCWTYFLKMYPNDFLDNRQLLSSYTNSVDQPYVLPSQRSTQTKPMDDLNYRPS